MTAMTSKRASPTVPTRRVASTLRMYRERADMGVGEAAKAADHQSSWLSRIESMENRAHPNDVQALMLIYGAEQSVIQALMDVARQSRKRGWWWRYNNVIPEWFGQYLGLESDASAIRTFEGMAIPGLLQTTDYARAAITASAVRLPAEQTERFVQLRRDRQQLLLEDTPPQYRAVLDEGVLRRLVGGRQVMIQQIEHLLELLAQPNIEIQVLPYEAGAHPAMNGSFVIMDFPPLPAPFPQTDDRIAYVDLLGAAKYFDQPPDVAPYEAVWEQLRGDALPADRSEALLRSIAKDLAQR